VHSAEYVQEHSTNNSRRTRAVRYTPHALEEQVYMHPQSALARTAPEFVAYTQVVRSAKRPYMTGKLAVYLMHGISVLFWIYLLKGILQVAVLKKRTRKGGAVVGRTRKDEC